MQVIGQQKYPFSTDASKDTQMILNAYLDDLAKCKNRGGMICNIAIDVFLLGMIYGKREERRKQKERCALQALRESKKPNENGAFLSVKAEGATDQA
jgi:hypothetical protein